MTYIAKSKAECGKGLRIKDVINRNLILREKKLAIKPSDTLVAAYKEKPEKIFEQYGALDLRGRNLEFADFYKADLRKADLRSAILQDANLKGVQLQGANLESARLQGAYFEGAQFRSDIGHHAL